MLKKRKKRNDERIYGVLFIAPAMLQFLVFFLVPLGLCIYASFTNWNTLSAHKTFVGLKNYISLLQDDKFWKALMNTVYMLIPIPVYLILSMLFAMACNKKVPGNKVFRVIYYLPYISSIVALVIIWKWIFNPEFGLINSMLRSWFGMKGPNWLNDPVWTKRMIVIMISWKLIGITAIYYLAALKNIPNTYYEAARVDGASSFKQFIKITLPMLSPTTLYLSIVGIIGSLQTFLEVQLFTTDGGRGYGVATVIYYTWQRAFKFNQMGYACAVATLFSLLILIITGIQLKVSGKWVYEGE
ncbi:MAG: binding-protein-dependent transport system inner rane component [Firmicutes bacterium]|nr:binding-protein-dependent transport system inner rane component [Bacillota bacterium]